MITDQELVSRAIAAYVDPPSWSTDDAYVCATEIDDAVILAFRGSACIQDWLRDLYWLPAKSITHPQIGKVHRGFLEDVEGVADSILRDVGDCPLVVTGHSKGGAEALIFAAILLSAGKALLKVTTFGSPRPGHLGGYLTGVMGADYRNGADPVPTVPLGFQAPRPYTCIGTARFPVEVEDHFVSNYRDTLAAVLGGQRSGLGPDGASP